LPVSQLACIGAIAFGEREYAEWIMPRSVRRAAEVLDLFSVERPYWGPSEVAVRLGIAKSSAHALLGELARAGLTERLPCGRHRLGWRLVGLARTMLQTNGYRETVAPAARALAAHFGETVHVAALERESVVYVASERPTGGVAAPPAPVAAELTPLGQVLLAQHPGVIVGPQRALDGVECVAAGLRTSAAPPAAAIGLCAPSERFASRRDVYARALAATSKRVSRAVRL
jgi:DNA-binding IclR family transcriptional regulator